MALMLVALPAMLVPSPGDAQEPADDRIVGTWCDPETECDKWAEIHGAGFGYAGVLRSRATVVPLRSLVAVERQSHGVGYIGTMDCSEFEKAVVDETATFGYFVDGDVLKMKGCGYTVPSTLVRATSSLSPPFHFDDPDRRASHAIIERLWPGLVESEDDLSPELTRYAVAVYACAVSGQRYLNNLQLWIRPVLSWKELGERIRDSVLRYNEAVEDFSWPVRTMVQTHRDRYERIGDPRLLEHRKCD